MWCPIVGRICIIATVKKVPALKAKAYPNKEAGKKLEEIWTIAAETIVATGVEEENSMI